MKISLVGGPYDATVYDIDVDRNGMPKLDVLYMPRRQTIAEGLIDVLANAPMAPVKDLRYRLVRVTEKELVNGRLCDFPTKWHWEYHYEG
ncbi:hypothetical protein V9Y99_20460 [Salmonella enterica]|uniref:Uncharacterized protein n=1 Tax=Salmonella enterica TaxID=28901 RepID=A0A759WIT5_SALER|nr:hypothetical protein [Salmonella enterica]EBP6407169.1 hypothetical protein [Salmonella enterica subsp. enterica]EBW2781512.1 hypothetical protein [Salmonella enterica subsp. enterica serovar Ibadan]ECD5543423.1 hypothetical protein [Salmonella enterica subsp. enterica serovar Kokomlemle]ECF2259200.1 hypothetical protein [Salmonella enterica subsp. enterica serovar Poona]EDA9019351.1 hypothetical protein [Salmonella enterica subsp. enterica serovar Shubra]EDK1317712.1 hypothetical protein 